MHVSANNNKQNADSNVNTTLNRMIVQWAWSTLARNRLVYFCKNAGRMETFSVGRIDIVEKPERQFQYRYVGTIVYVSISVGASAAHRIIIIIIECNLGSRLMKYVIDIPILAEIHLRKLHFHLLRLEKCMNIFFPLMF